MENPKNKDVFFNLKYISYCISNLTPNPKDLDFATFVNHCKFFLCSKTNTLMKAPIWNDYTDEEILIEYFSHVFNDNVESREEFENALKASGVGFKDEIDDFSDWADEMIERNKDELEQVKGEELEDNISFNPTGE